MSTSAISPQQVQFFEDNGYVHLSGVIGAEELESLRAAEDALTAPAMQSRLHNADYSYVRDPKTGKMMLSRIDWLHTKGEAFLKLYGHPVLLGIAEAIFGHDPVAPGGGFSMVVKSPGYGAAVPWHRDPGFCTLRHGINLGVYLDDATPQNGMLSVVPGSHKIEGIDLQEMIEEHGFDLPGAIPVATRAGDVVVHSENVLHGSRVVRSQTKRRVIYYGFRTIEEQLSRGLDADWVRSKARAMQFAIEKRAASNAGETPFRSSTMAPEYRVELRPNQYVELRIGE